MRTTQGLRLHAAAWARTRLASWACLTAAALSGPALAADWPSFGQNIGNTGAQPDETILSTDSVVQLQRKWTYTTEGDVSARAAVVGGVVYFPDWGGYLHAVQASTGQSVWKVKLDTYGLTGSADGSYHSRTLQKDYQP